MNKPNKLMISSSLALSLFATQVFADPASLPKQPNYTLKDTAMLVDVYNETNVAMVVNDDNKKEDRIITQSDAAKSSSDPADYLVPAHGKQTFTLTVKAKGTTIDESLSYLIISTAEIHGTNPGHDFISYFMVTPDRSINNDPHNRVKLGKIKEYDRFHRGDENNFEVLIDKFSISTGSWYSANPKHYKILIEKLI